MICPICCGRKPPCASCVAVTAKPVDRLPHAVQTHANVIVEQPERLLIRKPRHLRVIVTIAVGVEATKCLDAARMHFEHYARRCKADFIVLSIPGHPLWPMSAKFSWPRVLDYYEQAAYFDADMFIPPDAPNVFELAGDADWAACDEMPYHRQTENGKKLVKRYADWSKRDDPYYFNCGVQVARKAVQHLLLPPRYPLPNHHCGEQDYINLQMQSNKVHFRCLDRRVNWQNWQDPNFREAPHDAILHWSGSGVLRANRAAEIFVRAMQCPVPRHVEPWNPTGGVHWYNADARHVRWLREELQTGKYKRVLEIGCHFGYSTSAFLDALKHTLVEEVHLCDINITSQLRDTLRVYGVDVTLHECTSVELLSHDSNWDLVFLDGDHSVEAVSAEMELLRDVPAIFLHDTQGHLNCPGPPLFKERLLVDSRYKCWEDAEVRPNERTERGMFFAEMQRSAKPMREHPTFSIVVATKGRETLGRTLESIHRQVQPHDQVLVLYDDSDDYGATPRTRGMLEATGDYILFMDDDDVYVEGTLNVVRKACTDGKLHMFAVHGGPGWTVPLRHEIAEENVCTQMVAVPNDKTKFGVWGKRRNGDYDFISTLKFGEPVWHSDIIAIWRPTDGTDQCKESATPS